jgi:hypothetical protein
MDQLPIKKLERQELVLLFRIITEYYDNFSVTSEKVDAWYLILRDSDFHTLKTNLLQHIKNSSFAPKIKDLLNTRKPDEVARYIPGVEETQALLKTYEDKRERVLNDPNINIAKERATAEIRRILGK